MRRLGSNSSKSPRHSAEVQPLRKYQMPKPSNTETLDDFNRERPDENLAPAIFSTGENPESYFTRLYIRSLVDEDSQRRAKSAR